MYAKHCEETDQGILKMSAQNPKITSVVHMEAPGRKAPENGYEMQYRIRNGATLMDSVLYLALYRGKLIKVRISYSPEDLDEAAHAYIFIDAVAAMLNKEKTDSPMPPQDKPEARKSEAPQSEAKP